MCHVVPSIAKALHIRDVVGVATVYHRRMCWGRQWLKRSAVLPSTESINGRADTAGLLSSHPSSLCGSKRRRILQSVDASAAAIVLVRPPQKGFLGTPEVLVIEPGFAPGL